MPAADFMKNLGTDLKNSALGQVQKALLILNQAGPGAAAAAGLSVNPAQAAERALSAGTGAIQAANAAGPGRHVLEVQYNPSSISFQANADATAFKSLRTNEDSHVPLQNNRPPAVTMSLQLIFDQVNLRDAFMTWKSIIRLGTDHFSVRAQTNALIAMVMRDQTRNVTFKWANTTFTGEVTEAQAQYTMFSPSGEPIRSTIRLSISQELSTKADTSYWDKAFDACFGTADLNVAAAGRTFTENADRFLNNPFSSLRG